MSESSKFKSRGREEGRLSVLLPPCDLEVQSDIFVPAKNDAHPLFTENGNSSAGNGNSPAYNGKSPSYNVNITYLCEANQSKFFFITTRKNLLTEHHEHIQRWTSSSSKQAIRCHQIRSEDMTNFERTLSSLFSCKNREHWSNPSVWKEIVGELSITEREDCNQKVLSIEQSSRKEALVEDGYALVGTSFKDKNLASQLADAIEKLHRHQFPATFILLYDEAWKVANIGNEILTKNAHTNNVFNFDILAWYINPSEGMAGFSPHRDRQPDSKKKIANSFHEDGQAKYLTLWMALTDATPENSCLYVIPKQFDPGYLSGDDIDDHDEDKGDKNKGNFNSPSPETTRQDQDPLSRALQTKQAYQNIRALPRNAGESVVFTHRILHWGSKGNSRCEDARVAISFVSSDPLFERPYLRNSAKYMKIDKTSTVCSEDGNIGSTAVGTESFMLPPFKIRLVLVCAQLLIYYQRFDLPTDTIRACYEFCKDHSSELDETYYKKVTLEFVKAMREDKKSRLKKGDGGDVQNDEDDVDDDDDDDEAILEAMLDHADGDFSDDFDDMDDDDDRIVTNDLDSEEDGWDDDDDDDEGCTLFGVANNSSEPAAKKQRSS